MSEVLEDSTSYSDAERVKAIKQIYRDLLNREADSGGLNFYYECGLPIEKIAEEISLSAERQRLVRLENSGGVDYSMVEHWLGVGTHPAVDKAAKYAEAGFTAVLDLSEEASFDEDLFKSLMHIKTAPNRVFSATEIEQAIGFIHGFYTSRGPQEKLLICCFDGVTQSCAVLLLWYVANGMDKESASVFIKARRPSAIPESAMIGPWHYSAASKACSGE